VNDPFSGTMFERCTGGACVCVCVCVCVTGVRVRLFCPWKPPAALFSFRDEGFQRSL